MNIIKPTNCISSYIISSSTYLLESATPVAGNRIQTIIYDKHGVSTIDQKPLKLVRNTCRLHGTSLEAATETAKLFFGSNRHKLPIAVSIEYGNPCIIFPLFSPHSSANIWINLNSIVNIQEEGDETRLTFTNMVEKTLPIQCKSFNQQYVRAMMYYKHILRSRNTSL